MKTDRTTRDQLRVFISSSMQELAAERTEAKGSLDELQIDVWAFEDDAGARPQSIQKTFLDEIQRSDLFIGIFWNSYGQHTINEFEHARSLGKPCLIYEKRSEAE